jgi:DNA-binding SARP family transcriptional activator
VPRIADIPAPIVICVLGSFRLLKAGVVIEVRGGGKAEFLLSRLALRVNEGVRRETLLSGLWPDREPVLAGQSLNSLLYSLHRLLGDEIGGAAPVLQSSGYCRLNSEAGIAVDLAYFERFTDEGNGHARAGDAAEASLAYRQAVNCYRGDLCGSGDIGDLIERERCRSMYLTVLAWLADDSFCSGDYGECLESALRLLAQDPCREDAHRLVMRCHVRRGERAQALRQYRVCEEILHTEFEAVPEPVTVALFEQVRLNPAAV